MDLRLFSIILATVWTPVFEGEASGTGEGSGSGESGSGTGESGSGSGEGSGTGSGESGSDADFTPEQQEKINKMLAAEKRKYQTNQANLTKEIESLKAKSQLTSVERTELDQRVEKLKEELLTKEQIAAKKAAKAKKQHEEEMTALQADRDSWKSRYTVSTINSALMAAASQENAYNPQQIVALLGPNTTLEPVLNDEDQPTGQLAPVVRVQDKDKDGKDITLTLSPSDAVKGLKDKQEYLNLFNGTGVGGLGASTHKKVGGKADLKAIAGSGSASYRQARKDGTISFDN